MNDQKKPLIKGFGLFYEPVKYIYYMVKYHILKKGESMEQLSALYKVPVCMIMSANTVTFENGIVPGLKVRIPERDFCLPTRTHTVKKEDTIFSLSARFGVSMHSILEANALSHPSQLKEGMLLKIPKRVNLYTAGATDTFESIAKKLNIPSQKLKELNDINTVYHGMQIKLPD